MKNDHYDTEKIRNIILLILCVMLMAGIGMMNIVGNKEEDREIEQTEQNNKEENTNSDQNEYAEDVAAGITEGEVLRLMSYLYADAASQETLPVAEGMADIAEQTEFLPEMNATVLAGYWNSGNFNLDKMMDCADFRELLTNVCNAESINLLTVIEQLPERLKSARETDLLYADEFWMIYDVLREEIGKVDADRKLPVNKTLLVFDNSVPNRLIDENGNKYSYSGEKTGRENSAEANAFEGKCILAICSGSKILKITGESENAVCVPNAWVIKADNSQIELFAYGFRKTIETEFPLEQEISNTVCDITIRNGKITQVLCKPGKIEGKVLMTSADFIEIEGYGRLNLTENFRIYKIYGDLAQEKTGRILVGYSVADFVVEDGKLCAALIKEPVKTDNIRVLLSTNGYKSHYHSKVVLTADREFTVTQGGETKYCSAGTEVSFEAKKEWKKDERIYINTVGGEGKIKLLSVNRSYGNPVYRGSIEIAATEDGLLLVNELSLEEYLYAVIPSEMPTSYGVEALKVQAVCARSYAFNQMMSSRFQMYGAHVDDSVSCQVYNNVEENESSILAVKETNGLVAAYDGNVITAYYYSTSCGQTAYYEEVWENSSPLPYLVGRIQNSEQEQKDFSAEDVFRAFLSETDLKTYDSDFSWYRWKVELSAKELLARVKDTCDMDKITGVQVTKRGKSGIALELTVYGKAGKQSVEKVYSYQTAIRKFLAPEDNVLVRKDGSTVEGMSMLPSGFFVLDCEMKDGIVEAVKILGGGYGHGTGMSQNGVKSLIADGKSFEEILQYYYQGTDIVFLY